MGRLAPLAPTPMRVLVAARTDFALDGLLRLLKDDKDIAVVACVESSEKCGQAFRKEKPDVLLLQADMITAPVHEFVETVQSKLPKVRIIAFGQRMSREFLYEIVMAGIDGYINDKMTGAHVSQAIRTVMDGRLWVERDILEAMALHAKQMQNFVERSILDKIDSLRTHLTDRETTVLRLVLDGLSTKQIATEMCLSEQSVKLHLGNMFAKFEVTNRSQLILLMFSKVCPVSNMMRLFRMSLDKRRLKAGRAPVIADPLEGRPG